MAFENFDRAAGIGGSDVAAILGVSPWRTRTEVWLEKVKHPAYKPKAETAEMRFGTLLEPVLRQAYMADTGVIVHSPGEKTYWADDHIRYAHLDGLVHGEGIWEGKVPFQTWRQWEEGPPPYVLAQIQHYMDVTGEPWCDVSALAAGLDPIFQTWRVPSDPDTQANIKKAVLRFWNENVLQGIPPDDLPLAIQYPTHNSDLLVVADDEAEELVAKMFAARSMLSNEDEYVEQLKEQLKGKIGLAAGMKGNGWRIRWKKNRDSRKVEWQLVAEAYRKMLSQVEDLLTEGNVPDALRVLTDIDPDTIVGLYTTVSDGARPFVLEERE